MPNDSESNKCADDTEQIVINLPCKLVSRAQRYADENGNSITGVVIEALDAFLAGRTEVQFREPKKNPTFRK